jgi:hypothetical protein
MSDIGAKVYTIALGSSASHGDDSTHLQWIHDGSEVVRHVDYEKALKQILELEAKNTSLQADMEAVLKAASASTNLDVTEQLYRVIQERDALKLENKQAKADIADLQDKLRNGIEYDEENNQYFLVWTQREIDEAKEEADRICKILKFD